MWTRRELLATATLAVQARRPNVLVFLSDQETALLPGPADLPNRRRLEKAAVRFTTAFCNTPQCSAARSSLLTGLEPHRTGVLTNVDAGSLGRPLAPSIPGIGGVFQAAGYATGYFGKWHLGGARATFGFSEIGAETGDERIAAQAAGWIRKQRSPWLAYVSVLNPHEIYSLRDAPARPGVRAPFSDLRNLAGKPSEQQAYVDNDQGKQTRHYSPDDWIRYRCLYLSLVEKVDAHLGVVLGAIADLDSTVVMYASDHGDALGEHGLPFKGPFMYEEGIRIPLLIRAPWAFSGRYDELVTQADIAPTLAGLCGIKWPSAVDGRDLSKGPVNRDAVFLEYYAKQKWVNPIRTVRTRRWKLNWYDRGNRELYDLENDRHEIRNLAGDAGLRATQERLEARVTAWRGPIS
jgi:arylsulfatase A-like enzyme